jgi:hypothetical protein
LRPLLILLLLPSWLELPQGDDLLLPLPSAFALNKKDKK